MKIIVLVRTLNEEHRIAQFCKSYEGADMILVADGGSEDRTVEIASEFPNVYLSYYDKRVELEKGYWRNNDSDHTNFLISLSKEFDPDWVIFDDCDCRPNYLLKGQYRQILESTKANVVMAVRVFLWGKHNYLPGLSSPLGEPKGQASLWAWRGKLDLWTVDVPPAFTFRIGNKHIKDFRTDMKTLELLYPYCLLHYSWDDPVRVEKKVKYYRESGFIPGQLHPLDYGSPVKPLEEFMHE